MKKQAFNPYLPSYEYIPDGEPYLFNDRLYVFGSHDRFDGDDFCLNDYVCWSAPVDELGDWRFDGIIYRATQDPLNQDGTQHLFAPDVKRGRDGRYYLFYCLHHSPSVSVAVCDSPAGQYEFYGHVRHPDGSLYGQKPGDVFNFDPGVLIDDGQIFLFTGIAHVNEYVRTMLEEGGFLCAGSYCIELEQDMITLKSKPLLVAPGRGIAGGTGFEGHAFFEASSPRRIGGTYYLIYSSEKSHDLCYATCDRPDGQYSYGGVIVSNGDIGLKGSEDAVNYTGNTHGGLVEIDGAWYIFYHRHTNRHRNSRQACAEQIEIRPDGSISQVEVTSCGLNGAPLRAAGEYGAYIACNLSSEGGTFEYGPDKAESQEHPYFTQSGVDRESDSDQYIANLRNGAWAGYKYFSFTGNECEISIKVRGKATGMFIVSTTRTNEAIAQIAISPVEEWTGFSAALQVGQGIHALYLKFNGEDAVDFKSFKIT